VRKLHKVYRLKPWRNQLLRVRWFSQYYNLLIFLHSHRKRCSTSSKYIEMSLYISPQQSDSISAICSCLIIILPQWQVMSLVWLYEYQHLSVIL
jgi:hypothetical protein